MIVKIDSSWKKHLKAEFDKPYFQQLATFIKSEMAVGKIIYPKGSLIFNAFNTTPFEKVSVVILGQDPYHGTGQAHGLSFSVPKGMKAPPSLVNIFKELKTDVGCTMENNNGDLTAWAEQGILLLNAALTVRAGEPFSHAKYGWSEFTDAVIKKISEEKENIVFILWGKFAQQKKELIDEGKHLILMAPHPSPFSADTGFFGCKHFSKTNQYLIKKGKDPIDWNLR